MAWAWALAAWVLAALGVGVLLWALFWDRPGRRGRAGLRCRKCWYDLTGAGGAEGVSRASPVVCPECGRAHRSRRAMRGTRRRWWGVAMGVGLIVMSRSMASYPKVQERGWWQAAPSWALILSIPWMPGEVRNPDLEWGSIAWGRTSAHERAMANLFWRDRAGELGWLDYQLAALLARTEPEEFLCRKNRTRYEGVSPRAVAYGQLIESGWQRERLGESHQRWYRRLVHVELRTRDSWPVKSPILAYPDVRRAMNVHVAEHQIRVRLWSATRRPFIVDSFGNGELHFTEEASDILSTDGRNGSGGLFWSNRYRWSDGMIELPARDPENGTATTQVRVSEFLGHRGSLNVLETLIEDYELTVDYRRVGAVEDLIRVIESEDVLSELGRCLTAHGFWWHDALGRRHMAVAIDLTGTPRLVPGRYTFGSGSIGVRAPGGRLLQGEAWWAIDVSADGTAKMVHDRSFVLLYGAVTEDELVAGGSTEWELSISSRPMFCLRDLDTTQAVKGRIRLPVLWKQEPTSF